MQHAINPVDMSVITLIATALIGVSQVTWGGTLLDFFGIYVYDAGGISVPTGHSFTIVGDAFQKTGGLLVIAGLLGLAGWRKGEKRHELFERRR